MATIASKFVTRQLPIVSGDCAGDEVINDYFYDAAAADLALNNVIDIGILPANHTVTAMRLIVDDLDTNGSPTVKLDVGMMSGTPGDTVNSRTCGAEFFSQDTTAQAGGTATPTLKSAYLVQATGGDRSIGVKVQTAPATAAAGRIRLRVHMHPSDPNLAF
jgi:hypothetical protein